MKVRVLAVGKTEAGFIKTGIAEYETRIVRMIPFESVEIPAIRASSQVNVNVTKAKEAEKIMRHIAPPDFVVLLDEKGKEFRSVEFAGFMQAKFNSSIKSLVFVIGGPFGFADSVKARADHTLSLSKMTFSHQMVRLFFFEQLYRGLAIMNNTGYHHE